MLRDPLGPSERPEAPVLVQRFELRRHQSQRTRSFYSGHRYADSRLRGRPPLAPLAFDVAGLVELGEPDLMQTGLSRPGPR